MYSICTFYLAILRLCPLWDGFFQVTPNSKVGWKGDLQLGYEKVTLYLPPPGFLPSDPPHSFASKVTLGEAAVHRHLVPEVKLGERHKLLER